MFRFESPHYLYLLVLIPLLFIGFALVCRKMRRQRRRLADDTMWQRMVPDYSPRRQWLCFSLVMAALACLIGMMARPQFGLTSSSEDKKGIEAVFVMDVSNSMLAQDVQPNRLERAKLLVSTIIDRMKNDKVALAVFAGEAYPQLPITNDYASAKLFLDNLAPGMVTLQGTNIASAIKLGTISFTDKKDIGKAIIIITDGEDHEDGAVKAAQEAAKSGIKVFVLGVGSPTGSRIPQPDGTFLKDSNGQIVISSLSERMCREVAQAGGGAYFHVDNSNAAQQKLQTQLSQLKQADSEVSFTHPDEQFQALALLALILLTLEFFIWEKKNPMWRRFRLFKG